MPDPLQPDPQPEPPDAPAPGQAVPARPGRARRRLLNSIQLLPSFVTVLNALFGFAAIHFATLEPLGRLSLRNIEIAVWLLLGAMLADMLDGRIARMTRRTSDFGGQLDSLCDVVSFGAAPAILSLRTVIMLVHSVREPALRDAILFERFAWGIAAVYLACAALRLARFNVENEPDESAHMRFEGLPSPAAAASVMAVLLVLVRLGRRLDWMPPAGEALTTGAAWGLGVFAILLAGVTLLTGLLMVSRVDYPHLVNQYIRNRSPWSTLVALLIVVPLLIIEPYLTFGAAVLLYVLVTPFKGLWQRIRRHTVIQKAERPEA